jgi:3-methyladenine DNA glycosylase AlkD
MWTRRASILIHIQPARKQKLVDKFSWPTFEERLFEKEFFIRKAIGWTLRECSKFYPQQVHDFLLRVGEQASGLTRREGARNLPDSLRLDLLER